MGREPVDLKAAQQAYYSGIDHKNADMDWESTQAILHLYNTTINYMLLSTLKIAWVRISLILV